MSNNENNIPDRGDLVWINFTPQSGHEQSGHRPALVISPKIYHEKSKLTPVLDKNYLSS